MAVVIKRPQALLDLDEIFDYIAEDSLELAVNLLWKINEALEKLALNPYIGRKRYELLPNLRSFVYGKYVIFYFPISGGVDVVRILHGARDIVSIFEENNI